MLRMPRKQWKFWLLFAACFIVPQAINPWSFLPDYLGLRISGFPLIFFHAPEGVGYVYFDFVLFVVDLLVWYAVARAIVYGYEQLIKYQILK
jgi:hypothetical protein